MPTINETYGSGETLNAADLAGKGDVVVVFESFRSVKFDDGNKIVGKMRGKEKQLPLNFTNANTLAEISGSQDSDDWVGLRVVLFVTKVPFGGKMVDGIRIKPILDVQAPAPPLPKPRRAEPLDEDSIPFAWLLPLVLPLTAVLSTVLA